MKLDAAFWLSLLLAAQGCTGLILAGKGKWQGWALGLIAQPAWIVFGLLTGGYGLCLTSVLYGGVYSRNLWKWRQQTRAKTVFAESLEAEHVKADAVMAAWFAYYASDRRISDYLVERNPT